MVRTLYVNVIGAEKRIALQEDETIVEVFFQRPDEEDIVGNIYMGRVTKVLPGMQAAFVDIGMEKQAYLHRDDIPSAEAGKQISQLVHQGQAILVQVVKEAIETKGPKLTAKPELTGMYAVYMPHENMAAVSRSIQNQEKKSALQQLGKEQGGGFIFRSACEEAPLEEVAKELQQLQKTYEILMQSKGKIPALVHTAKSFLDRVFHEIPLHTVSHIFVDDRESQKILEQKAGIDKVALHREKEELFVHYGIEHEIEKALKKVVWLKNGAYLLIEQTETMTVIDVNTGKFTGRLTQDDTVLQTNMHGAKEIARQLRLRDIGGMIAIDFINMKERDDKEKVKRALIAGLKKDGTVSRVFDFTALGILEMTRKRKRKSLRDYMLSPCECCKGTGFAWAAETAAYMLQRELLQYRGTDYEAVLVEAGKLVQGAFEQLELAAELSVEVLFTDSLSHGYIIRHFGTKEEIKRRQS
nr:Rne/Rng family ribonuclease [Ectobacillus panaciterrae]